MEEQKQLVPATKAPRIIFLHIHKTGGMSLRGLFVKNYREGRHFNTNVQEMDSVAWGACLERIQRMTPEEIDGYQVFKGHMPFGLHQALPGKSRYVTFLREPVQRVLSYYRMMVRKNQLPAAHQIDPARSDWNLGAWPELARSLDNGQTRALSGADLRLPFGACTAEHLAMAKHNLDNHFDFVGLTEHFDLSLVLMRRLLGWSWHFYVPDNVAPQSSGAVSPEIHEKVRDLNRFDLELYQHGAERFQKLRDRYGWKLDLEHQTFVCGNAVHQQLHRLRQIRKAWQGTQRRPAMRPMDAFHATRT